MASLSESFPCPLLDTQFSRSVAGAATQGVPQAHVHKTGGRCKKPRTKKAAYVVFCGREIGVFRTWGQTEPLVKGVSNAILHGYTTTAEAEAAFAYALQKSWPTTSQDLNPLNGSKDLDDRWHVVYRGITPGVYRSHLESQLNTLGVPGALHKAIEGRRAALEKYAAATQHGDVSGVPPPAYSDDIFV
ncbi:hypothetical protein FB451DRAFT_1399006 [Mycena latifolia]|nr:hypothetical protein FB451DRAFT_1399006 [Mycena latifolia]